MGLFDKVRHQLIDIVEWEDMDSDVLVHKFQDYQNEIKYGAKLVVRPGQYAVFVNEGKIADGFSPGTYTLETKNLPVLRTLMSWPYGFDSPFKAEVYFIKTTELLDRKWGTPNPVMIRDADFGIVRFRARGNYSYKLGTNKDMISRFVGSQDEFAIQDMEGQMRTKLVSSLSDCIAELKIPALDLAAQYDEIAQAMMGKLQKPFARLGVEILAFNIENITLPEEVEKAMDQRSSMGALGNLNNFSQYQAANAVRDAANNEGEAGGMMGMMMGGQFASGAAGSLYQKDNNASSENKGSSSPPPIPGETEFYVAVNGQQTGPFPVSKLKLQIQSGAINKDTLLWKDGMSGWTAAGKVPELSKFFSSAPPPIPPQ